ncbi:conserved hypothetical protein [Caulobacter vibrioides CB15]|uniref:DUF2237 domain-containing protein n=2 Tax=Caulobacter vibrioides TaxID=155892 RepID=Q9A2A6_CAUVC|nr:conserved hypothetical protein [Caulobacter vibrioides CB15]
MELPCSLLCFVETLAVLRRSKSLSNEIIATGSRLVAGPSGAQDRAMTATRYDKNAKNVLGQELVPCSLDPVTGFYRNGCCETGPHDLGLHTVCAVMTRDFLAFSKAQGNDLSTPRPDLAFPGLKPGDRWCLCAGRWKEALDAGMAPQVVLEATHEEMLAVVPLGVLKDHAAA